MEPISQTTRFAPSPTGWLHLGHAYAAWFAREHGDRMLLRIEDIDAGRSRPEYKHDIFEDLAWLGISWDRHVRVQSEHLDDYARAIQKLEQLGLTYPCFCTRKEIQLELERSSEAPQGPDGPLYPGTCKSLTKTQQLERINSGMPWATRLDTQRAAQRIGHLTWREGNEQIAVQPEIFGDFVLRRKDVPTSYHVSVVVDDHLQGVTLVTRGHDLLPATHVQRLLQALLGYEPPHYLHHGLVVDEHGRRLAKRDHARTVRSFRDAGLLPGQVLDLARGSVQGTAF